jgi:hypothetical protein
MRCLAKRLISPAGGGGLCAEDALGAVGFGAGVGQMIALAIDRDDEHGASVAVAGGLIGGEGGRNSAMRSAVTDTLAETAMAELVGAAEEFDGVFGAVRSESGLHGAVMLVAKWKKIGPHRKEECSIRESQK